MEPEECSSRWKSLRDKFVREVKKVKAGKSGDSGPPYTPAWPLFNVMEFLMGTILHRQLVFGEVYNLSFKHDNICLSIEPTVTW